MSERISQVDDEDFGERVRQLLEDELDTQSSHWGLRSATPKIGATKDDPGEVVIDDFDNDPNYVYSDDSSYDDTSDNDSSDDAFLADIARRRHSQVVFNPDIPSEIPVTYMGKNDMEWYSKAPDIG
ncbi:hypothetical protein HHI36_009950, partial [Cryptolaemus montrouzieri]